jgi:transposase
VNFIPYGKIRSPQQATSELKWIGPIIACALVASIGNAHDFKNGYQLLPIWGLYPRSTVVTENQSLKG